MTLEDAPKNLHAWLDDLAALRPFLDDVNPEMASFTAAWKVALQKAKDAAQRYADLAKP